MGSALVIAIRWMTGFIQWIMVIRAILSWFIRDMSTPAGKFYGATIQMTEPFAGPIRDFLNKRGANSGMDWSLVIAFLIVEIIGNLLIRLVWLIF